MGQEYLECIYVFSASLDVNLPGSINVMLGLQNISKEGGVSVGILRKWVSVLKFLDLEMAVKSCFIWWPRWDRGVDLLPIIFFLHVVTNIFIIFFVKAW